MFFSHAKAVSTHKEQTYCCRQTYRSLCPVVSRYWLGSHPITELPFTLAVHSTHQQCQSNLRCKQWRGNRKTGSPKIFALFTPECNYIQTSMTANFTFKWPWRPVIIMSSSRAACAYWKVGNIVQLGHMLCTGQKISFKPKTVSPVFFFKKQLALIEHRRGARKEKMSWRNVSASRSWQP